MDVWGHLASMGSMLSWWRYKGYAIPRTRNRAYQRTTRTCQLERKSSILQSVDEYFPKTEDTLTTGGSRLVRATESSKDCVLHNEDDKKVLVLGSGKHDQIE